VHDGVVDVEAETMGCWRHGSCQLKVVAAAARSMLAELGYRRSGAIAGESRGKKGQRGAHRRYREKGRKEGSWASPEATEP
jgi:hypothetical protein